jgi:flagellar hook protein FlgE
MSSFSIALSGLTAASTDLSVTANNIANADTIGFKSSRAEFADLYTQGAADLNNSTTGEGVELATNSQQFTQGNVTTTSSNLDLAISGDGFFTLKDATNGTVYTRNGQFQADANGNVVSPDGAALQVYPPLTTAAGVTTGAFNTGTTTDLNLQTAQSAPLATTAGTVILNLPANSKPTTIAGNFDPTNSATYNQSTSTTVYDSLGNSYPSTFYFQATSTPAVWNVYQTINGVDVSSLPAPNPNNLPTTTNTQMQFDPNGTLTSVNTTAANGSGGAWSTTTPPPSLAFSYPVGGGTLPDGANPMTINFNFDSTTGYGGAFGVTAITQNGYATGQLSTVAIDTTGIVSAVYTNGRSTQLGQLAMANFPNQQGLKQLGSTDWAATFDSGDVVEGTAGSASFGTIQAGALESSNVDLTTALVNMITAQRAFDANAQVITTANQESQTVIQISR